MGGVEQHNGWLLMGVVLIVIGVGIIVGVKLGWPRLPGDILIQRENFTFYFPIVSSILLSLLLTLILNWFFRR